VSLEAIRSLVSMNYMQMPPLTRSRKNRRRLQSIDLLFIAHANEKHATPTNKKTFDSRQTPGVT
jgi:hypothetical protein